MRPLPPPRMGEATCADCDWRVATTAADWVGQLLQHRWQTHDKGRVGCG